MELLNPSPKNDDIEKLKLLAVFHYIVGAIGFLFACFPIIHLVVGIAMITSSGVETRHNEPVPAIVGYLFVAVAIIFILFGWTAAVCTIISGRLISKRKKRMFSFVMGCLLCIFMPFGTILGVFTIILLNSPSVKQLYQSSAEL